jgi:TatD DNase family protein
MFVDSHAHFDMVFSESGVSEESLLDTLSQKRIAHAVQVSIDLESLDWSADFIKRHDDGRFFFTMGIHPSTRTDTAMLEQFLGKADRYVSSPLKNRILGIGECGLDYYRMRQPKDLQLRSFEFQIEAAKDLDLPIIVHSRDATEDTISMLQKHRPLRGIIHCFPGNRDDARRFLDLGFHLSFAGNVTYNKSADMQDAATYVPSDRLLLETDAPFLTPVPHRGKKNSPEFVEFTYRFIAQLRKAPLAEIEDSVLENFTKLCRIKNAAAQPRHEKTEP